VDATSPLRESHDAILLATGHQNLRAIENLPEPYCLTSSKESMWCKTQMACGIIS